MYVGRDFDPSDDGEDERYSFDFVNDIPAGNTLASVIWTCVVAAKSSAPDPAADMCIIDAAEFAGTKTTQRVSGLVPGVTYVLTAIATTSADDVVSLWAHVECKEPA